MKFPEYLRSNTLIGGLAFALALATAAPSAHANVYASNIKINGGLTSAVANQGQNVNITYILNEPASAGVTINILSNAVVVRTVSVSGGADGALRGLNTVVWNGKDTGGSYVGLGTNYSVSITAASTGYSEWTTTTSDANEGNLVWEGRGIAVNQNTNSPYYGRIFVANSYAHSPVTVPGDNVGILKLNADGSYGDEGGFSTGGYAWAGDYYSPWKVEVSADDYVYINDWTGSGEIYRWNQTLSTASQLHVLRPDNWASGCSLSGPAILGTGTNTEIYMADTVDPGSQGIVKYTVTEDGTCAANNIGTGIIPISYPLSLYPYDVAVDKNTNFYIVQYRSSTTDASPRVMRYNSSYVSDWDTASLYPGAQQSGDWNYANGVAVDPTGTYLAVSFVGTSSLGNTRIFDAATGAIVTNLDLGMNINGTGTTHKDTDCCWDAVGNVYYIDNWYGIWRAVSPPGANSSRTQPPVVLAVVLPTPVITSSSFAGAVFTLNFTGGPFEAASAFEVLSCGTVVGTYTLASGQSITGSGGAFQATIPAGASAQFYRVHRKYVLPTPVITSSSFAGGVFTLNFTGGPSEAASAFEVLSCGTVVGTYTLASGQSITGSGGAFQATIPAGASTQFYKVHRK
jgi:hypothetical protein